MEKSVNTIYREYLNDWPGYPHPVSSELEKVVSEWRSMIAVSLNVGGGVIKPAKLTFARKTQHTLRYTVKNIRRIYGRVASNQLPFFLREHVKIISHGRIGQSKVVLLTAA